MQKMKLILGILILALAALACNMPGQSTPAAATPSPIVFATPLDAGPTATTPPAQDQPTATAAPPAQPSPTPVTNLVKVDFQGVSFSYPKPLASGVRPQIAPIEEGDPGTPGWPGSVPERYVFDFDGFALANGSHTPQIILFPIKEYAAANPPAGEIANKLDDQLRKNQPAAANLPFLPMWNAGQVFNARAEILAFQNGRGIRFASCYAQAIVPVDSACLFYTFQGLTADGKYYLSVIFPLRLPVLETPENKAKFSGSMDGPAFEAYMKEMVGLINQAQPGDFSPKLDDLDILARSLVAMPTAQLKGPGPAFSCAGAMDVRLLKGGRARVTFTDGTPLRLRKDPSKNATVLGTIPEGGAMAVVDGPQCVSQGVWWKVKVDASGKIGWVLEGENKVYYVEPWQ